MKNRMVEIRMMAVLSIGFKAGMKDRSAMTRIQAPTMMAALISLRLSEPISAYSTRALSRSPGMEAFSGLQKIMKNPQSANVMSQPMGIM